MSSLPLSDAEIDNLEAHGRGLLADEAQEHLIGMSDYELIVASASDPNTLELELRLKGAVERLTDELVEFHKSSDRLATRVVVLTAVMAVLTVALLALTVVLVVRAV